MEDPWGSPWAVADSTPPPTIDLPAAPPSVHFPTENKNTTTGVAKPSSSSPRKGSQTPWGDGYNDDEDDAWGGWNDAAAAPGASSPGWGRSPGLQPVAPSLSSRGASPDPWRLSGDDRRRSSSVNKRASQAESDQIGDSAISLGRGPVAPKLDRKLSSGAELESQNIWLTPQPVPEVSRPAPLVVETTEGTTASPTPSPVAVSPGEQSVEGVSPTGPSASKSSLKVHELVDLYDGIAKRSVTPVTPAPFEPPLRKVSSNGASAEDVSAVPDVEDIEDASDGPTTPQEVASSTPSVSSNDEDEKSSERESASERAASPEPSKPEPRQVTIDVSVDLSKLDDLFPSTPEINTEPEFVPDMIIDDSFTSISERKVWYRLSRQGSMRMHNLGDEENYLRMDWKRSAARQDTLKIVRRWMEEDSITGRPTMGRKTAIIGSSVFNWNSPAPEVEIGELLGRKKGHSRQASSGSRVSISSPPVASFDWASPPSSPITPMAPPSLAGRLKHSTTRSDRPQSLVAPRTSTTDSSGSLSQGIVSRERPSSLIVAPPVPTVSLSIDQALSQPELALNSFDGAGGGMPEDEEDDDDDWGDMVSSPNLGSTVETVAPRQPQQSVSNTDDALTPAGPERVAVKPIERKAQVIQDTPAVVPAPVTKVNEVTTKQEQVATDPWSLDQLDTWSSGHNVAQSSATTLPASLSGFGPDAMLNGAAPSTSKEEIQSPTFVWSAEPLQPAQPAQPVDINSGASSTKHSIDLPTKSKTPPVGKQAISSEDVDEEALARILRGIPDLSYMLR